jgi:O-acetyl-ADP-ribose deacetylase (regulator of RNase III)
MEKIKKYIKIIEGQITYPKTEAIIIPANSVGLMNKGILLTIIQEGFQIIEKEAKKVSKEKKIKIGECFSTNSGRLKKRGIKRIYHGVIKRFVNDFTSIEIIERAIDNSFKEVLKDKCESVSIVGIGIEDIGYKTAAKILFSISERYKSKIDIKIIDNNSDFIKELKILQENKNGHT